jgi:hypothetical protein
MKFLYIGFLKLNLIGFCLLLTIGFAIFPASMVYSDEFGGLIDYRQIDRRDADTNGIGTRYIIDSNEILFSYNFYENLKFDYQFQNENLLLQHADKTKYFSVNMQKHKSQLFYQATPELSLKIALPLIKVNKSDALYENIPEDDNSDFLLPLLHGKYVLTDLYFELASWQENDIQAAEHFRYYFIVYQYVMVGIGYEIAESHLIRFNRSNIDKIYPANDGNTYYENFIQYRILSPLKINDDFQWTEASLDYKEVIYTDTVVKSVHINNYLKFKLWDLTHFLNSEITWTDTITEFREGETKYYLKEESVKKTDITNTINYAGYTRLGTSAYFLSWKYEVQDSITQKNTLDQKIQLKIVYTF